MQVWLFDSSPSRRPLWQEHCQKNNVELKSFDLIAPDLYHPPEHSRLVVFDQGLVGDFVRAGELTKRLRHDAVAFTLSRCNCLLTMRLISLGARGVFDSGALQAELESGLSDLLRATHEIDQKLQRYKNLSKLHTGLSTAELDVLNLIMDGVANNRIAERLEVSVRTVEARRARIYRKCCVKSIVELVRFVDEFRSMRQIFDPESAQCVETSRQECGQPI